MASVQQFGLGLILLLIALGISALAVFLLRGLPRSQPAAFSRTAPPIPLELSRQTEAYLLVQAGGRILYISPLAQEWFNTHEETPNLERLVSHTRPTDTLLSLSAMAGQASFTLDGRSIEGTSYEIPYGANRAILISLRRQNILLDVAGEQNAAEKNVYTPQAFTIFSQLSQTMASSLELERTVQAVLESVQRLVPADYAVINIWEAERQVLITYRIAGNSELEPKVERGAEYSPRDDPYSSQLVAHRRHLLINEVERGRLERLTSDHQPPQLQAYLGVPLEVANSLVGTLELAALPGSNFNENDLQVVRILSGQAAVALQNALRYEREQRRADEMGGLAQLARAASSYAEQQDLYAHLLKSISPLINVEVLGFLIYDENSHMLRAEAPFQGLTPGVVEWSRFHIPPGSRGEALWGSAETIVAEDAPNDTRLHALGVHNLAVTAGATNMVLAPLAAGGRSLGYLLAADKRDATPFNPDNLRMLAVIAGQTAPLIENANLIRLSRRRAQRAESLRRIASLTASAATLDEMLKYSLLDLARLLQVDYAAIFLVAEGRGELQVHQASLFGVDEDMATRLGRLSMNDPEFQHSVTGSQTPYLGGQVLEDPRVLPLYRPLAMALGINSAIVVPLVARSHGIGEVMLGSISPNYFNQADLQTVLTAAVQLASAIERASLYTQTDETLRRRVDQLTAVDRISRELNSTLELPHLLRRVYDEALRTTQADCGTILLFELRQPERHERDYEPRVILHLGDKPGEMLHPLEQRVLTNGGAVIIDDFAELNEDQTLLPAHPDVRSALVMPIAYQDQVAGLIHLHAKNPGRFDHAAQEIVETLSIQAAIALGNAYRYQEEVKRSELLKRRVETLARLFEATQSLHPDQSLEAALEKIAFAIQAATPFNVVVVSVYKPESKCLERTSSVGITPAEMDELRAHPQSWSSLQQILAEEYRIGRSYFIPYERLPVMPPDIHTLVVLPLNGFADKEDAQPVLGWHPEDVLIMPLINQRGEPAGLISVDAPRNNLRPDQPTIETLEIFGNQAIFVIENLQKVGELGLQAQKLSDELQKSKIAAEDASRQLPMLVNKEQVQTLALEHLTESTRRLRIGYDIAEAVNRQPNRQAVLITLASELISRLALDCALVVEPGQAGPRLVHTLGAIRAGANLEALLGQRNPVHNSLHHGVNLLVANLKDNSEWANAPLLRVLGANAFICLAINTTGTTEAAILAVSKSPLPEFTHQDQDNFTLLLRQVAGTLQNLKLIAETNQRLAEVNLLLDFSRELGSLDTASILQKLVQRARHVVPTSQACMVALWDPQQELLLPQAASGYADNELMLQINYRKGEALPGQVLMNNETVILSEVEFAQHYSLSAENLLRYRDATGGQVPVSCLALPLRQAPVSPPLGVLILDNFLSPDAFNSKDEALISSLAQQTALHLENTRLYQAAQERANQLQALTRVAASITTKLQPDELVETLLDHLRAILPYDTGTLWLRQQYQVVVRAERGFADEYPRIGLTALIEDSVLLSEMIKTCQPISVADIRQDGRFSVLADPQYLSWLGLPLVTGDEVMGVIALEKKEANFYTAEQLQIANTFSSQAAVALDNARLFRESLSRTAELDQRSQRLEMLNRLSTSLSGSLDPQHIMQTIVQELGRAVALQRASVVLFDDNGAPMLHAEYPPGHQMLPVQLPDAPLFDHLQQTLGILNSDDIHSEPDLEPLLPFLDDRSTHSLLVVPLATGIYMHGLAMLHSERLSRFTPDEIGVARTITNQAAIALQNARLYAETHSLSQELEQRVVERTAQLANEHKRTELLLRISTELTTSLDLEQVLNRTLVIVNQIVDAGQITVLITRPGERNLYRLASLGYTEPINIGGNPTSINMDEGLAGWVISRRESALIDNILEDPRWILLESAPNPQHRSAMAVPLMVGAEALGVLLLYHQQISYFNKDQLSMVQAAANQMAVAINNAELYRLIRDQAEDLGNMFRSQQVEASRSRAILEAVADGVLVTDSGRHITLFNASAEKILGLERSQVIGKSLKHFTGLFGRAGHTWMETVQRWTHHPEVYHSGDIYSEQITLEDGRVVSVHLSPVSLRDSFLGTVSVFRDITHQVELDRLKSEFVATVSHELRTPMTSIKGYVDLLLMGAVGEVNEQQVRCLDIVKSNTERLSILVNDLLDISRIEAGREMLTMQALNLHELASEASGALVQRSQSENKVMHINVHAEAGLPLAYGDAERIRQVMDNLLENAYSYTQAGGHIAIQLHAVENEIQIDVSDDGIGIPPELQERVFERFYRGDHPFVLATSGTGLGLAIVQHLIEMHHGRIWLKSSGRPGEGSTFSFTIPVYK